MTTLLFALLIAASATASPAPALTPPPTIIHERVSPVCTTLHDLVLPLARLQTQYHQHLAQIAADEQLFVKYRGVRNSPGAPVISTNMFAFQIDMEASNAIESIHQIELLLIKSYNEYPQGKSPKVDALRQHVQNIVDLERATVNNIEFFFGTVVDNATANIGQNSASAYGVRVTSGAMTAPAGGGIDLPRQATPVPQPSVGVMPADTDPLISSTPPPGVRAPDLKFYGLGELRDSLQSEGRALISQAMVAAGDCDGA